jgi:hypothetical protein
MKHDPDFAPHRQITADPDSVRLFARRAGSSRAYNVIAAVTLLALLVAAVVTRGTISDEIADSNVDRQSYVAFLIDVVTTLGLCIGLAWLLFSCRPVRDDH